MRSGYWSLLVVSSAYNEQQQMLCDVALFDLHVLFELHVS